MAKQPGYQSRSTNSGTGELKSRLLFVLGALIVYRIGSFIPLPGIDAAVLAQLVEQQKGTIIDMLNMFSGGHLAPGVVPAYGAFPWPDVPSGIAVCGRFIRFRFPDGGLYPFDKSEPVV